MHGERGWSESFCYVEEVLNRQIKIQSLCSLFKCSQRGLLFFLNVVKSIRENLSLIANLLGSLRHS